MNLFKVYLFEQVIAYFMKRILFIKFLNQIGFDVAILDLWTENQIIESLQAVFNLGIHESMFLLWYPFQSNLSLESLKDNLSNIISFSSFYYSSERGELSTEIF